jgi:hypothetical protein
MRLILARFKYPLEKLQRHLGESPTRRPLQPEASLGGLVGGGGIE